MLLTIKFFTGVKKTPEEIVNAHFLPLSISLFFLQYMTLGLTTLIFSMLKNRMQIEVSYSK